MPFAAGNVLLRMLQVMPGPWLQGAPYAAFPRRSTPPPPQREVPPPPDERPAAAPARPAPAPDTAGVEVLRREPTSSSAPSLADRAAPAAPKRRRAAAAPKRR